VVNTFEVDPDTGLVSVSTIVTGPDATEVVAQLNGQPNSFVNVVEDTDQDVAESEEFSTSVDTVFFLMMGLALFCLGLTLALVIRVRSGKEPAKKTLVSNRSAPYEVPM
jgi:hypothetical protein